MQSTNIKIKVHLTKNYFILEKCEVTVFKNNIFQNLYLNLSAPVISQDSALFVSHFTTVFTRNFSFQVIYIMKGNYTKKTFLISHTFLYENYNSRFFCFFNISQDMLIKLSMEWGIKHQTLRKLNFWWPENFVILNLTNIN